MKVLLASTMCPAFVQEDIESLNTLYKLDVLIDHGLTSIPKFFLRAARARVSVNWFGSVYSWFLVAGARMFGQRSVIILGGVDTARLPELNYGLWNTPWKARMLRAALHRADVVLAVDQSLKHRLEVSSGQRWDKVQIVPTGYDAAVWQPGTSTGQPVVLCVAGCGSVTQARVKGIDTLLQAAALLPGVAFRVVGVTAPAAELLRGQFPAPNVEWVEPVPRTQLLPHYQNARVYCQPSRSEGLPNALCEAMLCGCVPVGTRVGGVPHAIGDTGFVVAPGDPQALAAALTQALLQTGGVNSSPRDRIATLFPRQLRIRRLQQIIDDLAQR